MSMNFTQVKTSIYNRWSNIYCMKKEEKGFIFKKLSEYGICFWLTEQAN